MNGRDNADPTDTHDGHLTLGAIPLPGEGCRFRLWAPRAERVELELLTPARRRVALAPQPRGYHEATVDRVPAGALYRYRLHSPSGRRPPRVRPDPAARSQPRGVHGPSQVVDPGADGWDDAGWQGPGLADYVIYELHVGTFTPAGTFAAVIPRLPELVDLGITAVELMPVAQFPGGRNWGYDGVAPFAVQNTYGGPDGLRRLVQACHAAGLAVVLDVVYNHLGPEGNYLHDFGPYFTDCYQTPWGAALNFDGPQSDEVRRYFIENALHWLREYHIDALRLDAVHAILDRSAVPFLAELAAAVQAEARRQDRSLHLVAESDLNDVRVIRPPARGGYGIDAQWNDDFHHALHALLSGEHQGYYQDFGTVANLAAAYRQGYVYTGQYSRYRQRRHGNDPVGTDPWQFVVCAQNHDQVGNRRRGDRLSQLTDWAGLKLAAGAVLLSPFIPLLFMGEEYGETAPFQYFVSHGDTDLVAAVRQGRRREFAAAGWRVRVPDPQSEATFQRSRLRWQRRRRGRQRLLLDFHRELLRLRRSLPAPSCGSEFNFQVVHPDGAPWLLFHRQVSNVTTVTLLHFGPAAATLTLPLPAGHWRMELDSSAERWDGPGSLLPVELTSPGEVNLTVQGRSLALLRQSKEGQ